MILDSHTNTVISHTVATRQDGFQNCDKVYYQIDFLCFQLINKIGHFRVPKYLTFKTRLSAKPLI